MGNQKKFVYVHMAQWSDENPEIMGVYNSITALIENLSGDLALNYFTELDHIKPAREGLAEEGLRVGIVDAKIFAKKLATFIATLTRADTVWESDLPDEPVWEGAKHWIEKKILEEKEG